MLDSALSSTDGVEHLRFNRFHALFGRLDAIQFHWPEVMLGNGRGMKGLARRMFAQALRIRLSLGNVAVIRTVHNLTAQESVAGWRQRYLDWLERRTDHRILLNAQTVVPAGAESTLIPHGHYRDWFADVPAVDAEPDALGFVGLIRPYKGVEDLIAAFRALPGQELRLHIAGNPVNSEIRAEIERSAAEDSRIRLDLRYLDEPAFARAVMQSAGIVLPYRFMHNSGAALAALSLNRPVLAPRTSVNEALSDEVGAGWVSMFDGEFDADDLRRFAAGIAERPSAPPDLSARGWDAAGAAHREAFQRAVEHRRRRATSSGKAAA